MACAQRLQEHGGLNQVADIILTALYYSWCITLTFTTSYPSYFFRAPNSIIDPILIMKVPI